jgi:plastocyanin domain-containing protein
MNEGMKRAFSGMFGRRGGASGGREIDIAVTEQGFEPPTIDVSKGAPVILVVTRKTERTCAREIVIDELAVREKLPIGVPVRIAITPTNPGQIAFGCAMGKMVRGTLNVG